MKTNAISVSGGAVPKFDRAAIMARAWSMFRETYSHPSIKFSSIGWKCFGSCVRRPELAQALERVRLRIFRQKDECVVQAKIVKYRHHAMLAVTDPVTKQRIDELIAELEEQLRKMDE